MVRATKVVYSSGVLASCWTKTHIGFDARDDAKGLDEVIEGHVAAEPATIDVPQHMFGPPRWAEGAPARPTHSVGAGHLSAGIGGSAATDRLIARVAKYPGR